MVKREPLNLALWGIGQHASRTLLPAIRASEEVRLLGVHSRNRDVVAATCHAYACRSWESESEMLADPAVEAVYLATPVGLHREQGLAVLAAGKNLLCEKPLAMDRVAAGELAQAARTHGRLLFEAFMYLHHPRFVGLLEILRSGRLGRVRSISSAFTLPPLVNPGYRHDASLGGGALLDVGCYPVSLALALDSTVPTVAHARWELIAGKGVDGFGTATLRLGGGADAAMTWGYGCGYRNEVTIIAEHGSAQLDRVFTKGGETACGLTLFDQHGKPELIAYPVVSSFTAMFTAVHEAIRDPLQHHQHRAKVELQASVMDTIRLRANGNQR